MQQLGLSHTPENTSTSHLFSSHSTGSKFMKEFITKLSLLHTMLYSSANPPTYTISSTYSKLVLLDHLISSLSNALLIHLASKSLIALSTFMLHHYGTRYQLHFDIVLPIVNQILF
jgi:hypothetical protein